MAQNKYMAQSVYDEKKAAKKAAAARTSGRAEASEDPKLRSEFQRYKRDTEIELEELRRRGSPATGTGTPGAPGKDGVSPVVSVSKVGKVTTIAITDVQGTKVATILDGKDGVGGDGTGSGGEDGIGIASIVQTVKSTEDDGINVLTVALTDGSVHTFEVQNGSRGSNGTNGKDGADGKTPVRGSDYWTDSDIASIKSYLETVILNGEW